MEKILNLTQHMPTPEQIEAGVVEPTLFKEDIKEILTFDEIPSEEEMEERAWKLARITYIEHCELFVKENKNITHVMIGGAPFFMKYLVNAFVEKVYGTEEYVPVYAFSKRVSEDVIQEDGSVKKTNVFKHVGFIEA